MIWDNRLTSRSYFISFSRKKRMEGTKPRKKITLEQGVVLSGEWDFHFFQDPNEPTAVVGANGMAFDRI